jgi:hypothetical protein
VHFAGDMWRGESIPRNVDVRQQADVKWDILRRVGCSSREYMHGPGAYISNFYLFIYLGNGELAM